MIQEESVKLHQHINEVILKKNFPANESVVCRKRIVTIWKQNKLVDAKVGNRFFYNNRNEKLSELAFTRENCQTSLGLLYERCFAQFYPPIQI